MSQDLPVPPPRSSPRRLLLAADSSSEQPRQPAESGDLHAGAVTRLTCNAYLPAADVGALAAPLDFPVRQSSRFSACTLSVPLTLPYTTF